MVPGPADDSAPRVDVPDDVTHRRNYLAGMWAAELLGLFGRAASDYARQVLHTGHRPDAVHGDDHDTVVRKLTHDLEGRVSLPEIRDKMAHFLAEAKKQMTRGGPPG